MSTYIIRDITEKNEFNKYMEKIKELTRQLRIVPKYSLDYLKILNKRDKLMSKVFKKFANKVEK